MSGTPFYGVLKESPLLYIETPLLYIETLCGSPDSLRFPNHF